VAINVQMQIEIDPDIDILHFYGHDLITDPVARAAVEREADITGKRLEENYGVKPQPHLIKEDKGIRVFVPNLAVGETYWIVFELKVPKLSNLGKTKIRYFDTFARQNQENQFHLSPKGQIVPQLVTQHALGLWTSEVLSDALLDIEADDLVTAEKRIQAHISVLEAAGVVDDIITLNKFLTLAQNQRVSNTRDYLDYGLQELENVRNGFVRMSRNE
jgi:hypothetical protein